MDRSERMRLYFDMIQCCHNLYYWQFDREMTLLDTDCPEQPAAKVLTELADNRELIYNSVRSYTHPVIISDDLELSWIAMPERDSDSKLSAIHVMGPFFLDGDMVEKILTRLKKEGFSQTLLVDLTRFLKSLPSISMSRMYEYAIMLYYCLTGQRSTVSDMHFRESTVSSDRTFSESEDSHGTYALEREMVRMVREGNLNYRAQMNKIAVSGRVGKLANDPLRQTKNAVITCITLFSRAAIEGGLSPETSLRLSDHYYQAVEACTSIHDVSEITFTMQDDYVQRVHRIRAGSVSKQILDCCEYIDTHVERELSLPQLAKELNYSESYLSHKFKEETGVTMREYIRKKRLERAKELLLLHEESILDIATRLHFCSQSYFAEAFRTEYGMTPTQYRENKAEVQSI